MEVLGWMGVRRRALVGALVVAAGLLGAAVLAPVALAGAVGVSAQLPANAAANPSVGLGPVSCASAGNCTAVGTYDDSSGKAEGLLLSEASGSWARGVEAVLPANVLTAPPVSYDDPTSVRVGLGSVSCASAGNCTAVGVYYDSSRNRQGLLLSESSGSWAPGIEAPLPANAPANSFVTDLSSVACASAGNCTAVGTYDDGLGLLLNESSGSWTAVEAPLPANASRTPGVVLSSVSCASAGNCTAVGTYWDSSGVTHGWHGLLLSESSGSWTAAEAPLPANAATAADPYVPGPTLNSVLCASAGNCTAVGTYSDSSRNQHGLLLSESSGSWTAAEAVLPANAAANPYGTLGSVSCASAGNCTAVGTYWDSSHNQHGLLLSESSGSWAPGVEAPLPANLPANTNALLGSVSCASAGNCTAVGTYFESSGNEQGLLLRESLGSWTAAEAPLPANVPANTHATLYSVSCASAGNCTAIGGYTTPLGNQQGLLEDIGPAASGAPLGPSISNLRARQVSLPGRRLRGRCVKQTRNNKADRRCRRAIKIKVSYTLNIAATVKITLRRKTPGRKVAGRCLAPTKKNKRHKTCTRVVVVPDKTTQTAQAGAHSFMLNGRIAGETLAPGVYQLSATPLANGVSGPPRRVTFTITR